MEIFKLASKKNPPSFTKIGEKYNITKQRANKIYLDISRQRPGDNSRLTASTAGVK